MIKHPLGYAALLLTGLCLTSCVSASHTGDSTLPEDLRQRLELLADPGKGDLFQGPNLMDRPFPLSTGDRLYFAFRQVNAPRPPQLAGEFLPGPFTMTRYKGTDVYYISLANSPQFQGARYKFLKTLTTGTAEETDPLNPFLDYGRPQMSRIILPGWEGETFLRIRKWKFQKPGTQLPPRDVFLWLPGGYQIHPQWKLPVLYMHDGQQVWDSQASAWGGWKVETAARRLISEGKIPPLMIVGVANSPLRGQEFLSWVPGRAGASSSRGQMAADYGEFFAREVKVWVDKTFRTLPGRESTAIVGSSNGASISLCLSALYPETYGLVAGLSGANAPAPVLLNLNHQPESFKIYLDCGGMDLDGHLAPTVEKYYRGLLEKGFTAGQNLQYHFYPEALHNEAAWAQRMPQILEWFFGKDLYSWTGEGNGPGSSRP